MKEKKKLIKQPSGSLKVDHVVLKDVRAYCKENGILVSFFGTEALKKHLNDLKAIKRS